MIPRTKPTVPRTLPVPDPFIAIKPRIIATTGAMHQSRHHKTPIIPKINEIIPKANVFDFDIITHTHKE